MPALALQDRYGRVARDLRVSLIDRCNLRCAYCMPAEGLAWLPSEGVLSDAEVSRLVRIGVELLGITDVRFTGGEPLLRKGLVGIVAAASALRGPAGRPSVSLTTNALGLDKIAARLRDAGLDRINISLDTLDRERFAAITRRDRLPDVLAGIEAARSAGLAPIKINAVPQPDTYVADAPALLDFCLRRGLHLRFIEHMPIGPDGSWERERVVTAAQLRTALEAAGFRLGAAHDRGSAPAAVVDVAKPGVGAGDVGLIASVSEPFCAACSRTRLTADGQVRSCLFSTNETDLRALLRGGASDAAIAERWCEAMWGKPRAHGIDNAGFANPSRTMSMIGG